MQLKSRTKLQNGKYEIVRALGQGGFGITYEAEQVLLRRKFALKEFFMKDCCERDEATCLVTVGTGSQRALVEKFRVKFIREAQMIAGFDHPNIVRVTDVFEENGTAYYVMENLPGGSLADKVKKEGPLSEEQAEKYIRQIADALAYIHSQNTVHLDIKPSNILLNPRGEAVLIDFGISKHYDDSGEQTSSTPVGISKGYAPIEQGRDGDVSQFKPSTDIYALGATLYHLVTGSVPPEASIVYEDGLDRPQSISDRMWKVIDSAMQPKRKDRPQNIAAFLSLLDSKDKTRVSGLPEKPIVPAQNLVDPSASSNDSENTVFNSQGPKKSPGATGEPTTGSINGHEWVDLGLSVKWATCNLGASFPCDEGDYFAWGETKPKTEYKLLNSYSPKAGVLSDKVTLKLDGELGEVEIKRGRLALSGDAARANLGGSWRMPTLEEIIELCGMCIWTWTTLGGKKGYKVTSKINGNSIFLPAAGYRIGKRLVDRGSFGLYWSMHCERSHCAWSLIFLSDKEGGYHSGNTPYYGFSIRPVTE